MQSKGTGSWHGVCVASASQRMRPTKVAEWGRCDVSCPVALDHDLMA